METHPPSLSTQLAALRSTVPTGPVEGYWVLNSVIETIFAALLRVFSRLEDMVELWQTGLLPLPTPRATPPNTKTPRTKTPATPNTRTPSARNPRNPTAHTRLPAAQPAIPHPQIPPRPAPAPPRPNIRATHDPPPPGFPKKHPSAIAPKHNYFVP